MASSERNATAAGPSSMGWAKGASGWIHSRPCFSSGSVRQNGDATAIGWIAEQTSCRYPGSVSSAVRAPPPGVSAASNTATDRPACASAIAAESPFGPAPTTAASKLSPTRVE